jgi:outer membrane protein OmpU
MKNVLFATTALVLTAGVASAEVTFSGKAEAGVIDTKNKAAIVYSGIDINVGASVTTENGVTVSATTDMGAGYIADVADKEIDLQDNVDSNDMSAPEVKVSMDGFTVELQSEGVDDYYDGDLDNYDVGVTGAMAGLTFGVALETEKAAGGSDYSIKAGYAAGPVSVSIASNEAASTLTKISASYTMGAITATVTNDNKGAQASINTVKVAYAQDGVSASISFADDKDHAGNTNTGTKASWDVAVGYTAGAMGINFSTNESDKWEADVSYDLGGATAFAATDSNETMMAGINFAF